jgi:hypothetical protein
MEGAITTYSGTTVTVTVDNISSTGGNRTGWTIQQAGPIGASGSTGLVGATGSTGPIGASGSTGLTGSSGATGSTGVQGASGLQGASGASGSTGLTGATGATGFQGASGATGFTGTTGPQGEIGATGITGSTGYDGPPGIDGTTGATGFQGASGATGVRGLQGLTGSSGATGSTGIQGASGSTGQLGASGSTGLTGATGSTGPIGSTGPQGILKPWQTITGATQLVNGAQVIAKTTTGPFSVALPAFPTTDFALVIQDGDSFRANPLTVIPNGSTIRGTAGDLILDVYNALVYFIYDGTTWQISSTIGAVGATGPGGAGSTVPGPTGATGLRGSTGTAGITGASGVNGSTGINGASGATGLVSTNTPYNFTAQQVFGATTSTVLGVKLGNNAVENTFISVIAPIAIQPFDCQLYKNWYSTANATVAWTMNFRGTAAITLNSLMAVGDTINVNLLSTNNLTTTFNNAVQIDGTATGVTTKWITIKLGVTTVAPTASVAGIDTYNYTIIKTGAAPTYTVIVRVESHS